MQRLATHLKIELEEEFGIFAVKAKMVYAVDNMNTLEDTFQKVHTLERAYPFTGLLFNES